MTSADYLQAMIFVAPALCSMVCALFVAMLIRDFRNSAESRLRVLAVAFFLIVSIIWLALLVILYAPAAGGVADASKRIPRFVWIILVVAALVIPLGQLWLTHYIIRRQHADGEELSARTSPKKSKDAPDNAPAKDSESDAELSKKILEEYFARHRPYLDPEFKLTDLADAMGVNRSEMSAFINRTFEVNFKRYVNRWRLAEYERLMGLPSNEFKNPYKIVTMAGFSDTRHYHRVVEMEK